MFLKIFFLALVLLFSTSTITAQTKPVFKVWLQGLKKEFIKLGISAKTFDSSLGDLSSPLEKIIKKDRTQAEKVLTFADYYKTRGLDYRASEIAKIEANYSDLFRRIKTEYDVNSRILLSFWSLETSLGKLQGTNKIPHVLATLAYDHRRSKYFKSELINALKIIEQENLNPDKFVGSWAGASGHMQFMPYNILNYSKDGNSDGKINPWQDEEDALMSAAYFLKRLGWQPSQPWGWEVYIKNYKGKSTTSYKYFKSKGIMIADNHKLKKPPVSSKKYTLVQPLGENGIKFLVSDNFSIIKKWNNSEFYALTVGILADKISGIEISKEIK